MLLGHCNHLCGEDDTWVVLAETDRIKVVNDVPWVGGGQFLTVCRVPLLFLYIVYGQPEPWLLLVSAVLTLKALRSKPEERWSCEALAKEHSRDSG